MVGSIRQQASDPGYFEMLGVRLGALRSLVVKSRGHFRALPGELLHVDGKPAVDPCEGIARAEAWVLRRMRANIPATEIAGLYEIAEVQ